MSHRTHDAHAHAHGTNCGHKAIQHDGHVDECTLEVSSKNPAACTPAHACTAHEASHAHGPGCGHDAVPHGDHVDYLVSGHLHHAHGGHCDDHGPIAVL
jgi:hypothetical protein